MKRHIQHEYLKVSHFTATEWQHPVHNHNHFELIYVHRGKGVHHLGEMQFPYDGPCLFLLAPCDAHSFVIEEETEFTFLKFTNVYLHGTGQVQVQQRWNQVMDEVLQEARALREGLLAGSPDLVRVDELMRMIAAEWKATRSDWNETIFFLIQALLSVVRRNVEVDLLKAPRQQGEKMTAILHYLHRNIYNNDLIQIDTLAEEFGYSKHYIGSFFKDQMGMGLRDYINEYRMKLIEGRLKYSALSLKEISAEMGFTDLSHFNKFVKIHRGVSPSVYRKQV